MKGAANPADFHTFLQNSTLFRPFVRTLGGNDIIIIFAAKALLMRMQRPLALVQKRKGDIVKRKGDITGKRKGDITDFLWCVAGRDHAG